MKKRKPTTDSPVSRIIAEFGGIRPMSRKSGWPASGWHPSTIQSWEDSGHIPSRHQQKILDLANKEEIKLGPADFFAKPKPRESASRAGAA